MEEEKEELTEEQTENVCIPVVKTTGFIDSCIFTLFKC